MKIHKGKLSTSNAVVIGVLVIVLYAVIPGGSKQQRAEKTDPSVSEALIVTSSDPGTSVHSDALPNQEQKSSIPEYPKEGIGLSSANPLFRSFLEIDEQKLQEIASRSPFSTTAAMVRSADVSDADTPTNAVAEPAPDEISLAADLASKSTVKLFYSSSTGRQAAVLNDDIVYQGTLVSEKLTVESIHSDGVRIRHSTPIPQTEP